MYSIGEYISYGNSGVCEVIGTSEMAGQAAGGSARICYILQPLHDRSCRIMTPVDNTKVVMRSLLTKEQTRELLADIPEIEPIPNQSARQQELSYQKALYSGDCREWISLIKTLRGRIEMRKEKGKKITATDDRYFRAVTEKLTEEFSVVLGMDADKTKEMLEDAFTS